MNVLLGILVWSLVGVGLVGVIYLIALWITIGVLTDGLRHPGK